MPTLSPWNLVDPVEATIFVRELPDPYGDDPGVLDFLNVLPDRRVATNKARFGTVTRRSYAAVYRTWDSESPLGRRNLKATEQEVELPPISQKLPLRESEFLELMFLNQNGTTPAYDAALVNEAFDDLRNQTDSIKLRLALAKAQLLTTGKFTLAGENNLFAETDYAIGSGQKPTASPLWTNAASSTPIADEEAWVLAMTQLGFKRPRKAYTRLAMAQALGKTTQYKTVRYAGAASLTNVPDLSIDEVNQVRAQRGLPQLVVVEHAITNYLGTDVPLIPAGKLVMVADGLGETQLGVTRDSFQLIRTGALTRETAPGLIGGTWFSEDPITSWTKVSGCGMPILDDPRQLTIATIG
jgi:hypothetical protein